jgi:hypothetical protein
MGWAGAWFAGGNGLTHGDDVGRGFRKWPSAVSFLLIYHFQFMLNFKFKLKHVVPSCFKF